MRFGCDTGNGDIATSALADSWEIRNGRLKSVDQYSGEEETIWGSMVKQALKRRKPGFNESYYGFRTFSQLLEEAERQGLIKLEHDERSGGYIVKAVYPET